LLLPLRDHIATDVTFSLSRRACLSLMLSPGVAAAFQWRPNNAPLPGDWLCPMDPDVRSEKPGVCPRCGMKLVVSVPDRIEYPLDMSHSPTLLHPGRPVTITLRVLDPKTRRPVRSFEIVHERLMHLFVVSENLEFFAHDHPVPQPDGSFRLMTTLPYGGMYRLLADYYPSGSVPQLAVNTLFVSGATTPARLVISLAPSRATNLTASLRLEPEQPIAGLETKLFYSLTPAVGLEPYLGAPGHMLAASADLIDLLHLHPFLSSAGNIQFNVIFPRPGLYRVWTQFQRESVVNTVMFTIPVKDL
jgi:Heavy metal binding domain